MQLLKKVISLLLVVAMLGSFAPMASADDGAESSTESENLVLKAYRADGTEIGAGDTVTAGDTIKVRIVTTEDVQCHSFVVLVDYDSSVLQANRAASTMGDICDQFNDQDITVFISDNRDEKHVPVGTPAIQLTVAAGKKNISAPAGTVWAEFDFTALKETEGTTLTAHPTDCRVLKEADHGESGVLLDSFKLEGIVPGSVTVAINAAPVAVESVTLDKTKLSLAHGATEQLMATVLPENADDKTVTWESGDATIASVLDGLVTGLQEGTTTITAAAGGKTATCTVNVAAEGEVPITGISIDGAAARSVTLNGTLNLTAIVTPQDATHAKDVSWKSDNPDVAAVVADASNPLNGVVSAKAVGTAVITATVGDYSASVTVNVSVPATKITITSDAKGMPVPIGTTLHLKATVEPENATDVIEWTSNKPTIVSVSNNGVVTALSAGTATITAKGTQKRAMYSVKVIDLGNGDYVVSMPGDWTVTPGEEVSLPIGVSTSNEEITAYNAFKLQMTYDPDALELMTTASDLGKDVSLTDEDGEIEILRHGEARTFGTMLTLRFKVKAVTDVDKNPTTVSLLSAQVDNSANALDKNAPNAQITNPSTTLTISVRHFVKLPAGMASSQGSSVNDGENYNFSLDAPEAFYDYTVAATMGGAPVEVKQNEDGTYTIENVTAEVEITLTKTPKTYQVTLTGEDVTGAKSATYGTDYVFKVDKKDGFKYEITAKIAGQAYTGELTPDAEGNYKIPGTEIKGAVEIAVTKTQDTETTTFGVYVEGTGKNDVTAPERATKGTDFSFTVNMEAGYMYTVDITVNGAAYSGATFADTEDGAKRTYTIKGTDVIGFITIAVAKDKAFNVTFENADPNVIKPNGDAMGKVGTAYTFTIPSMIRVYTLNVSAIENGAQKDVDITSTVQGADSTTCSYTCTVEDVQGDLAISLSWAASEDFVEVVVKPFVEWDDKTVYLIATRTKAGYSQFLKLDTYDDDCMLPTGIYLDAFANPLTGKGDTFLWLTTVDKGQSFTKEDALEKLSYTNNKTATVGHDGLKNSADVNGSGYKDINDAQLVWDIYNNKYASFARSSYLKSPKPVYFDPQENALTMVKFIDADVNRDMRVDALDAAAVINQIK